MLALKQLCITGKRVFRINNTQVSIPILNSVQFPHLILYRLTEFTKQWKVPVYQYMYYLV